MLDRKLCELLAMFDEGGLDCTIINCAPPFAAASNAPAKS
jgi:hypothetical protein